MQEPRYDIPCLMFCNSLCHHILHSTIFLKARGEETGRMIPEETLKAALEQVPKSVEILRKKVDYYCELNNSPDLEDIEILTNDLDWETFKRTWQQTCAWIPKAKNNAKKIRVASDTLSP